MRTEIFTDCYTVGEMIFSIENERRRTWLLIAALAIAVALMLMLMPHAHSGGPDLALVVLPIWFIGVLSSFSLSWAFECFDPNRTTDIPSLQPSFQRPPPFRLA